MFNITQEEENELLINITSSKVYLHNSELCHRRVAAQLLVINNFQKFTQKSETITEKA